LLAATASAALLWAAEAQATIVLTFEGLHDKESVNNYYNGGFGAGNTFYSGPVAGPGPSDGVTFTSNALALISNTATPPGSGNFSGEPSAVTANYFRTGTSETMSSTEPITSLSFFYSATTTLMVAVFSGPNGTGTELASQQFSLTQNTAPFNMWVSESVPFSGTAESVVFSGTANQIGLDNITLGAVPAPMIGHGLLGVLAVGGILFGAKLWERSRRRPSPGTVMPHAVP
jgi:hypothetical protein